jgi:hypothetical protein
LPLRVATRARQLPAGPSPGTETCSKAATGTVTCKLASLTGWSNVTSVPTGIGTNGQGGEGEYRDGNGAEGGGGGYGGSGGGGGGSYVAASSKSASVTVTNSSQDGSVIITLLESSSQ